MSGKVNSLRPRLGTLFSNFFRREKFYVLEKTLVDACSEIEPKVKVDVRLFHRDDLPKNAKFKLGIDGDEKFGTNDMCATAEIHGELVHWSWVAFNEAYVGEIERKIRINSDSAYVYAVYTAQEYRGLGIASKAMEKICDYLYEMGVRKVYLYTRHDNFPMLRVAHKAEYQKIGTMRFIKVCKLKLYRCKGETEKDQDTLTRMLSI